MNKSKCFWCKGKTKLGVHSKCWKVFSGWMLSERNTADMGTVEYVEDEDNIEYRQPNGQSYINKQGMAVNEGHVMKTPLGFEDER